LLSVLHHLAIASPRPPSYSLPLHDALPIYRLDLAHPLQQTPRGDVDDLDVQRLLRIEVLVQDGFGDPRGGGDIVHRRGLEAQTRSEEHTSELQSRFDLVCRLLLEKKNNWV